MSVRYKVKVRVNVTLEEVTKAWGEKMNSFPLSLTSTLDWVGGELHAQFALPLGKTWYPFYSRLVGPQGWSGQVRKMSPRLEFDFRTVQPVASRYNDCALQAQYVVHEFKTNKTRSCDLN